MTTPNPSDPLKVRPYDPSARPAFDEWVEVVPGRAPARPRRRVLKRLFAMIGLSAFLAALLFGAYMLVFRPRKLEQKARHLNGALKEVEIAYTTLTPLQSAPTRDKRDKRRFTYRFKLENAPKEGLASKLRWHGEVAPGVGSIRSIQVTPGKTPTEIVVSFAQTSAELGGWFYLDQLSDKSGQMFKVWMERSVGWNGRFGPIPPKPSTGKSAPKTSAAPNPPKKIVAPPKQTPPDKTSPTSPDSDTEKPLDPNAASKHG